jgi:hypothetical protein
MAKEHLGNLELMVLLALLRVQRGAYGVPISREIAEQTGREVAIGSVYAALERLERKGMVSSALGEPSAERGGGPSAISRSLERAPARCATRSVCLRTCGGISPD